MSDAQGYWKAWVLDLSGQKWTEPVYGYTEAQYWQVARALKARNLEVLELSWKKSSKAMPDVFQNNKRIALLESVLRMTSAGKTPASALKHVIEGAAGHPSLRLQLEPARAVLTQTGSFSRALKASGLFPGAVLSILEAGEASPKGGIESIKDAIRHLQSQQEAVKKNTGKVALVAFELFGSFSMSWTIYEKGGSVMGNILNKAEIGDATQLTGRVGIALKLNEMLLWAGLSITLAFALFCLMYAMGNYSMRQRLDPVLSRIPVLRSLIVDNSFSVAFAVMARILKSGGQFDKAVATAKASTQVPPVRAYLEEIEAGLKKGKTLSQVLNSKLLTHEEKATVGAFSSLSQVGAVFETWAVARAHLLSKNISKLILISTVFAIVSSIIVGWVLVENYQVLQDAMNQQMQQAGTF